MPPIGLSELILISVIALLLFGPDQLPELARKLGSLTATLQKQSDSLRRAFYNSIYPPLLPPESSVKVNKDSSDAPPDSKSMLLNSDNQTAASLDDRSQNKGDQ
ncbi:MAG TPA: twin-arginine translocase TatA/TatE family subunit [Oligoflexia bacterium]|nr:twin-arginine translocase TatA/TatE family subunit [Oligoflexia bacterium]HMP27504.1 twin-arginine translocase TatA/TatE family subunit [Oligoflexia bacterium]